MRFSNLILGLFIDNNHKPTGMCLSWFTGQLSGVKFFTHAGGGRGFYCEIRIYPEINTGSVIVFNRTGMRDERFLDNNDKYFIKNN
jgi:D-alanyl-D-alanine carboxypeptidase